MQPHYEEGKYLGRVISQALGKTKNGNAQFVVQATILGKIDPMDPQGDLIRCQSYDRTIYRVINENTAQYAIQDLQTLGYSRESFAFLDPATPGFHDFKGREIEMKCDHERDHNGDQREKWSVARGSSELKVEPIDKAAVRSLDNLFGKQLKAAVAKAPAAPQQAAVPKPQSGGVAVAEPPDADFAEISDEDIPF